MGRLTDFLTAPTLADGLRKATAPGTVIPHSPTP